ncbi:MAG: hypothetical protein E5X80_28790 [Mesorhizobium sp.]|uniref:hypothetical protein n=1 Tax=Mesorhizobium sp. TaxID=1871066 RepID=UPI00121DC4DD|nr:hypothetical protein [Mesorhizobium sp.]TIO48209.1 MAG: hypothetical protein E5X78_30145 [Mesorhizobium sp.]TIO56632.1 MAG: hypothetical protein E5X79_29775 [Mesorhizobium sp.]TJV58040.1 MAG: hypothetical protein E5X80_28790 [Mesorhizobium sp.]
MSTKPAGSPVYSLEMWLSAHRLAGHHAKDKESGAPSTGILVRSPGDQNAGRKLDGKTGLAKAYLSNLV